MWRVLIAPVLIVLFFGWILYRLLIRKDLKQHMNELYAGLFFVSIWAVAYIFLLR